MPAANRKDNVISRKLRERVKELSCLYDISRVAQQNAASLEATLTEVIRIIPQGWQYPEKMSACIRLDDTLYGDTRATYLYQYAFLEIGGKKRGTLEVFYKNETGKNKKEHFLPEEQKLIDQIAMDLSRIIESHEHREREKQMEARMQFNDRLSILGEFTAGIAHELNTPLGNILGYAQLLQDDETNRSKIKDLHKIVNSAMRAREIVKKLMFFSCEMPSQFKPADLNELVLENLDLINIQLRENKVKTILDLADKVPPVRVDALQFSQVLFNLVLNAIYAMPSGGKLKIGTIPNEEFVMLTIEDDGVGIAKQDLSRIFEPFYSTKPTGEGTGLGLAVVHGIMKAHGGEIEARSEKGKGTLFTLKFRKSD